jgi:hypothetical protein
MIAATQSNSQVAVLAQGSLVVVVKHQDQQHQQYKYKQADGTHKRSLDTFNGNYDSRFS